MVARSFPQKILGNSAELVASEYAVDLTENPENPSLKNCLENALVFL